MIKDIAASVSTDRDGAADYALSVAETFGAPLVVVGFACDPMVN